MCWAQLTGRAQFNSMVKSLEQELWSHCQQVSFSSHSRCRPVTRVASICFSLCIASCAMCMCLSSFTYVYCPPITCVHVLLRFLQWVFMIFKRLVMTIRYGQGGGFGVILSWSYFLDENTFADDDDQIWLEFMWWWFWVGWFWWFWGDDQIWSAGGGFGVIFSWSGKVDWLRRPQAAPFNETPSHPLPSSSTLTSSSASSSSSSSMSSSSLIIPK